MFHHVLLPGEAKLGGHSPGNHVLVCRSGDYDSTFSNFINNITSIPMGDTAFLGGYRSK
jgi:hypothetical protein